MLHTARRLASISPFTYMTYMPKPFDNQLSNPEPVHGEVPYGSDAQARDARRSWFRRLLRALVFAAFFVLTAVILTIGVVVLLGGRKAPTNYYHTTRSLEAAFNWVHCGRYSELHDQGLRSIYDSPSLPYATPFVKVVDSSFGGIAIYCNGTFSAVKNEDSSLFYLFSAAMLVLPNASANTMFLGLTALMMACILVFVAAVAAVSKSLILTLATLGTTVGLYATLSIDQYLSVRVFMWPPLLLFAGVLILAFRTRVHARWFPAVLVSFSMGVTAAFVMNMRSALMLHVGAVWLTYLLFVFFSDASENDAGLVRRVKGVLVPTTAFVAGIVLFRVALIGPLDRLPTVGITHHPLAHPIVLGLAVPPNRFTESQGIFWDDGVGLEIARRIDPDIDQLSPEYESALWTYYRRLWVGYPVQMTRIYLRKGNETSLWEVAYTQSVYIGWLTPFWIIPSGYYVMGLILLIIVFGMKNRTTRWEPRNLVVGTVAAISFAEYIESVTTYTAKSLYYPLLIFSVLFFGAFLWSALEQRLIPRPVITLWQRAQHALI